MKQSEYIILNEAEKRLEWAKRTLDKSVVRDNWLFVNGMLHTLKCLNEFDELKRLVQIILSEIYNLYRDND
jgi:hypothetical protein